jgi:uncharacterized protein YodC (DUF2158 family)
LRPDSAGVRNQAGIGPDVDKWTDGKAQTNEQQEVDEMNNFASSYQIGDKVQIVPLERIGRVLSVWFTKTGVQYEVRYFDNAKVELVYFYEDELAPMETKK